jgi:uncharacterized protein YxeA
MKIMMLLWILVFTVACEHKTGAKCEKHELSYIQIVPEAQIANQASSDMTHQCGGAYNIETMVDNGKEIIYTFSCPATCK